MKPMNNEWQTPTCRLYRGEKDEDDFLRKAICMHSKHWAWSCQRLERNRTRAASSPLHTTSQERFLRKAICMHSKHWAWSCQRLERNRTRAASSHPSTRRHRNVSYARPSACILSTEPGAVRDWRGTGREQHRLHSTRRHRNVSYARPSACILSTEPGAVRDWRGTGREQHRLHSTRRHRNVT